MQQWAQLAGRRGGVVERLTVDMAAAAAALLRTTAAPTGEVIDFEDDGIMQSRRKLRQSPVLLEVLEMWWKTALGSTNSASTLYPDVLRKKGYIQMVRKIYKAVVEDYDEDDCQQTAEEDWDADSRGKYYLDQEAVYNSLFELADLWTNSIEAEDYADFLSGLFGCITKGGTELNIAGGGFVWRDDDDIHHAGYVMPGDEEEHTPTRRGGIRAADLAKLEEAEMTAIRERRGRRRSSLDFGPGARRGSVQVGRRGSIGLLTGGRIDELCSIDPLSGSVDALSGSIDALNGSVDALSGSVDALSGSVDSLTAAGSQPALPASLGGTSQRRASQTLVGSFGPGSAALTNRSNDIPVAARSAKSPALGSSRVGTSIYGTKGTTSKITVPPVGAQNRAAATAAAVAKEAAAVAQVSLFQSVRRTSLRTMTKPRTVAPEPVVPIDQWRILSRNNDLASFSFPVLEHAAAPRPMGDGPPPPSRRPPAVSVGNAMASGGMSSASPGGGSMPSRPTLKSKSTKKRGFGVSTSLPNIPTRSGGGQHQRSPARPAREPTYRLGGANVLIVDH